jgi:hypothetical protein
MTRPLRWLPDPHLPPDRLHAKSGKANSAEDARAAVRLAYLRDVERGCDPVWNLPPGAFRYIGPVVAQLAPSDMPPEPFRHTPQAVSGWPATASRAHGLFL